MREQVVLDLGHARERTRLLTDLDEPTLVAQHDPLMSPLVWDLAHIGQQEELWLLRAGDPRRPGMLPPDVDSLYDAFRHPRAERPALPLLPPVEARSYVGEVRGRVLDLIERTPEEDLFTAGMVVQHEQQHDETMLATLQLRSGPPVLGGHPLPAGRPLDTDRVFVGGGEFVLGVDGADEPFSLDNERPAHRVYVPPFWIGRVPVTNAQWAQFVADGGYAQQRWWSERGWAHRVAAGIERPKFWTARGTRARFGVEEEIAPDEPVQHVDYFEAEAFAAWAGARLPTEVEWEKACCVGSGHAHPPPMAVGLGGAVRRDGQPRRRRAAAGPGRRVPRRCVRLRRRAADRRRLGVDLLGLPAVARLHADDLQAVQRPVLRRRLQGAARWLVGGRGLDRPAVVSQLGPPDPPADLHRSAAGVVGRRRCGRPGG